MSVLLKQSTTKHQLVFLACSMLMVVGACATSEPSHYASADKPAAAEKANLTEAKPYSVPPGGAGAVDAASDSNLTALKELWQTRMSQTSEDRASPEFLLGPGDVVQIAIPQIPQLANRQERVSERDTIDLPMLGEINVSGMTQADLLRTLTQRTSKYVYHPQVDVFIQHTENRQVAVIGAVKIPGRYTLASKSDTVMTMIGHAGGMTETAGSRIILVPGSQSPNVRSPAGATNSQAAVRDILRQRVVISTTDPDDQRYLDLPAKPGDVILVPTSGEVTVQGWVNKPGGFPVTPGMTVLSSIAAAGGALFSNSATLLRQQDDGKKLDLSLDLAKLKDGQERDVPVQSGDVIVVERSVVGAVPYSLYFLVQRVGIGLPVIPF